ncbi:MAG: CPBP family intramembrane metalloprotease [Anaerolineae bacterium]|jgi:membrane protease YdiL (CAAX protease family)
MKPGGFRALGVYLAQIPIVVACAAGWIPFHPIVVVLPLVVLLSAKVEGRGWEGLGLVVVRPGRSFLLALVLAALAFGGHLIALRLEAVPLRFPPLTATVLTGLIRDLAVDVFIIALWEEIVSRGYIQTRLQEEWGFWGMIVATVLFASLHLPSALLDQRWCCSLVLSRLLQTGLSGFMLGYVYWRTRSVPATIAVHGLRNFALTLTGYLSDLPPAQILASQIPFQLAWLMGQVVLMVLAVRLLFGGGDV